MRHAVRAIASLLLVVAGLIAGLLLGELGYRVAGHTVSAPTHGGFYYPRFYFKADQVNGHDLAEGFSGDSFTLPDYIRSNGAPFAVSSNSLGCRDRPFARQDDYVLLLGDSLTWGYVPLEQTWGATLEQLIGSRVLNCGVGGYGPRHERHKMETVVAKAGRPRLVIVGYFPGNDLLDDYLYPGRTVIDGYMVNKVTLADAVSGDRAVHSDEQLRARLDSFLQQKPVGLIDGVKAFLDEHSAVYHRLRKSKVLRRTASRFGLADAPPSVLDGFEAFLPIDLYPWLDKAWEEHLANLWQLNSAVESMGAKMLVVTLPYPPQVYESVRPQEIQLDWEYPNKKLSKFFEEEHIAFLDLLPAFQEFARRNGGSHASLHEDLYWRDDGHLNVEGNRLAGLLISRYVLEQTFPGLQDKDKRLSHVKQLLAGSTDVASANLQ